MRPWYISVDIETSGPIPGRYSLLAIGACVVADPSTVFYAELQPEHDGVDRAALDVSGLSLDVLAAEGETPEEALPRLATWVDAVTPDGHRPVFVAFNAPFDWMFVAEALHRHVGRNPFGHSALDIKALEMGVSRVDWGETSFAAVAARHGIDGALPHHALADACLQAEVFLRILEAGRSEE